jgi:hypothetical protein
MQGNSDMMLSGHRRTCTAIYDENWSEFSRGVQTLLHRAQPYQGKQSGPFCQCNCYQATGKLICFATSIQSSVEKFQLAGVPGSDEI